jgi:anthranilate phosphoribosyltransferase
VLRCVEEVGIGFCLAPKFHPAFRFAAPSRREIGIATVFNLLGPMANPGRVRRQLIGVANPAVAERMLASLRLHGSERAWVVHGQGLDEMTTTGETSVAELSDGQVRLVTVTPEAVGLPRAALADLTGGAPKENAQALRRLLAGEPGPYRDIVLLNSAAAFLVGDTVETLREGVELAGAVIDDGRAQAALDKLVALAGA